MTIKVTSGECCEPAIFEPYSLTLHVDNLDDHMTLKYLSMCNSVIPNALHKRAAEGYVGGKYEEKSNMIRRQCRSFLLALATKIPKREV